MDFHAHSLYVIKTKKDRAFLYLLDYIERVCMDFHAHSFYVIKTKKDRAFLYIALRLDFFPSGILAGP